MSSHSSASSEPHAHSNTASHKHFLNTNGDETPLKRQKTEFDSGSYCSPPPPLSSPTPTPSPSGSPLHEQDGWGVPPPSLHSNYHNNQQLASTRTFDDAYSSTSPHITSLDSWKQSATKELDMLQQWSTQLAQTASNSIIPSQIITSILHYQFTPPLSSLAVDGCSIGSLSFTSYVCSPPSGLSCGLGAPPSLTSKLARAAMAATAASAANALAQVSAAAAVEASQLGLDEETPPLEALERKRAELADRIKNFQHDAGRKLTKSAEPPRNKTHWDYLLAEMQWMQGDFERERKWKTALAKKVSRAILNHFKREKSKEFRGIRDEVIQRRKRAAWVSREIKKFWANIGKLVKYKHNAVVEEEKKKQMQRHLDILVDQTETFSNKLAADLTSKLPNELQTDSSSTANNAASSSTPAADTATPTSSPSVTFADTTSLIAPKPSSSNVSISSQVSSSSHSSSAESMSDDVDDDDAATDASPANLDSIMHDLRGPQLQPCSQRGDAQQKRQRIAEAASRDASASADDVADDDDFGDTSQSDDEATLSEEEEQQQAEGVTAKQEVDELNEDAELSIEELKKKYGLLDQHSDEEDEEEENDGGDEEEDEDAEEGEDEDEELSDEEMEDATDNAENENKTESEVKVGDSSSSPADASSSGEPISEEQRVTSASELAASAQPSGFTYSTTKVKTKIPHLLRFGTLREYQHIGLDWMVTMYDNKLNGILADEMGLGKTIMTIALLAHLAVEKGIWGQHLIIVPTSVIINWEMEFKRWLPSFKVLCYHGSARDRKIKRRGWSDPNTFHVCITSYQLVLQDAVIFRRKRWHYLILDEAHNIKNFKSQRWQTLLNFRTERRLLLTGTPLQNSLMELWSLMHFLMPNIFQSKTEFQTWFHNPVTSMIEGKESVNNKLIARLHTILRPFLLRRLKTNVAKQLPPKYEHVVMCRMSKRQRYLYEDFMSASDTQKTLASGNFIGMMNALMQLRKVCVAGDMPITLASGVSHPLEDINMNHTVLTHSQQDNGAIASHITAHINSGKQHCIELLFNNGRTLVCTPDHELLCIDGTWVRADHVGVKRACVVGGMEAPLVKLESNEWSINFGSINLDMSVNVESTFAFSRLIGYACGDACVQLATGLTSSPALVFQSSIDAQACLRDIATISGQQINIHNYGSLFIVNLPHSLCQSLEQCGVLFGDRRLVTHFPSFLFAPDCPLSVIREFLGALFGAAGLPITLNNDKITASTSSFQGVSISLCRDLHSVEQQQLVTRQQLSSLFSRFQIKELSHLESLIMDDTNNMCSNQSPLIQFSLSSHSTLAFAEHIGFRYCTLQQMRLTTAAGYLRVHRLIAQQQQSLRDLVITIPASSSSLSFESTLMQAKSQLALHSIVHPQVLEWRPSQQAELFADTQLSSISAHNYLQQINATQLFSDHSSLFTHSNSDSISLLSSQPLPPSFNHSIDSPLNSCPTVVLHCVGMRQVGVRAVFDITVPKHSSFIAAGCVVHNCNHPDLFAGRPIVSPFDQIDPLVVSIPSRVQHLLPDQTDEHPKLGNLTLEMYNLLLINHQINTITKWEAKSVSELQTPRQIIESITSAQRQEDYILHPVPPIHPIDPSVQPTLARVEQTRVAWRVSRRAHLSALNALRCSAHSFALYDASLLRAVRILHPVTHIHVLAAQTHMALARPLSTSLVNSVKSYEQRSIECDDMLKNFVCIIPRVRARPPIVSSIHPDASKLRRQEVDTALMLQTLSPTTHLFHTSFSHQQIYFPDKLLLQYDCGKLQMLATMLRKLQTEGHRVLIFSQMSSMLNILEGFLNIYGYKYLRLDGATKVEERSKLMEKFNRDTRYFVFILSTRSGGLGLNLTGADTVIFYDSDWNPSMDAQAMDRAHRLGQTKDVHVYRLITSHTIEENILKKSNQKRHLNNVVIGGLTSSNQTAFQQAQEMDKLDPAELFGLKAINEQPTLTQTSSVKLEVVEEKKSEDGSAEVPETYTKEEIALMISSVEDEEDRIALQKATAELEADATEFTSIEQKPVELPTHTSQHKGGTAVRSLGSNVGGLRAPGPASFENSLTPVQRYALHFAEFVDPFITKEQMKAAHKQLVVDEEKWVQKQAKLPTSNSLTSLSAADAASHSMDTSSDHVKSEPSIKQEPNSSSSSSSPPSFLSPTSQPPPSPFPGTQVSKNWIAGNRLDNNKTQSDQYNQYSLYYCATSPFNNLPYINAIHIDDLSSLSASVLSLADHSHPEDDSLQRVFYESTYKYADPCDHLNSVQSNYSYFTSPSSLQLGQLPLIPSAQALLSSPYYSTVARRSMHHRSYMSAMKYLANHQGFTYEREIVEAPLQVDTLDDTVSESSSDDEDYGLFANEEQISRMLGPRVDSAKSAVAPKKGSSSSTTSTLRKRYVGVEGEVRVGVLENGDVVSVRIPWYKLHHGGIDRSSLVLSLSRGRDSEQHKHQQALKQSAGSQQQHQTNISINTSATPVSSSSALSSAFLSTSLLLPPANKQAITSSTAPSRALIAAASAGINTQPSSTAGAANTASNAAPTTNGTSTTTTTPSTDPNSLTPQKRKREGLFAKASTSSSSSRVRPTQADENLVRERVPWSNEEDQILQTFALEWGTNWAFIAQMLGSIPKFSGRLRSSKDCQQRFSLLQQKKLEKSGVSSSSQSGSNAAPSTSGTSSSGNVPASGSSAAASSGSAAPANSSSKDTKDSSAMDVDEEVEKKKKKSSKKEKEKKDKSESSKSDSKGDKDKEKDKEKDKDKDKEKKSSDKDKDKDKTSSSSAAAVVGAAGGSAPVTVSATGANTLKLNIPKAAPASPPLTGSGGFGSKEIVRSIDRATKFMKSEQTAVRSQLRSAFNLAPQEESGPNAPQKAISLPIHVSHKNAILEAHTKLGLPPAAMGKTLMPHQIIQLRTRRQQQRQNVPIDDKQRHAQSGGMPMSGAPQSISGAPSSRYPPGPGGASIPPNAQRGNTPQGSGAPGAPRGNNGNYPPNQYPPHRPGNAPAAGGSAPYPPAGAPGAAPSAAPYPNNAGGSQRGGTPTAGAPPGSNYNPNNAPINYPPASNVNAPQHRSQSPADYANYSMPGAPNSSAPPNFQGNPGAPVNYSGPPPNQPVNSMPRSGAPVNPSMPVSAKPGGAMPSSSAPYNSAQPNYPPNASQGAPRPNYPGNSPANANYNNMQRGSGGNYNYPPPANNNTPGGR